MSNHTITGTGSTEYVAFLYWMLEHRVLAKSAFIGTDGRWAISVDAPYDQEATEYDVIDEGPMDFTFDDMTNLLCPWLAPK